MVYNLVLRNHDYSIKAIYMYLESSTNTLVLMKIYSLQEAIDK